MGAWFVFLPFPFLREFGKFCCLGRRRGGKKSDKFTFWVEYTPTNCLKIMEDIFGDRVFKTITRSVYDTQSSCSPNSTYFHLDIRLCKYTNRKDTAGQSSRHNPGHILIRKLEFLRYRYKLYLIERPGAQNRSNQIRSSWEVGDWVEDLGGFGSVGSALG